MENKPSHAFYHKFILCFLSGLVSAASFHRLAPLFSGLMQPNIIMEILTVLLFLGSISFAIYWQFKSNNNPSTLQLWQGILRFGIAFDLAMFAWVKIFRLQFWVPIEKLDEPFGSISSDWLTWMYFGRSYPMDLTIAIAQLIASFLLLFSKTRLAGVFMMLPILLNIFLIDIFYEMGSVALHAGIMLAGTTYLLFAEYNSLKEFFFQSKERLPSVKMNSFVKMSLRCSLIVVPLLFVSLRKSSDQNPGLKGKYEVQRISINGADKTSSIKCDSVLTVVYMEVGNTCIFQCKSHKQRIMGHYDYQKASNEFNVRWLRPEDYLKLRENYNVRTQPPELTATLLLTDSKHAKLSGKMGNNTIEAELLKVR